MLLIAAETARTDDKRRLDRREKSSGNQGLIASICQDSSGGCDSLLEATQDDELSDDLFEPTPMQAPTVAIQMPANIAKYAIDCTDFG